jgi:hypothetical protein
MEEVSPAEAGAATRVTATLTASKELISALMDDPHDARYILFDHLEYWTSPLLASSGRQHFLSLCYPCSFCLEKP